MNRKKLFYREAGAVFFSSLFYRNPVLIGALGLYPVVTAATGLRCAEELSLLFFLLALPVNLLLCLLGMLVPQWARPALVLAMTGAFYFPAAWLLALVFPGYNADLGMAAALMVCNSVIFSRAGEYAPGHIALAVFADTVGCSLGFAVMVCIVGGIRELWRKGGFWGAFSAVGEGWNLPFFGFILLAFLAAAVQWINARRTERGARKNGRVL